MLQIAQSLAAAFADEEGESLDAAVAAFVAAREAHALTVGVPAPVAHPLVERIVLVERGAYEIVDDPPPDGAAAEPALPLLSRRQVLFGLFDDGFVTLAEFEASATAVPASIAQIIDTAPGFDAAARAREKVRFLTMEYARRDHPLTLMLQASRPGMTDGEVDAMWLRWAAL